MQSRPFNRRAWMTLAVIASAACSDDIPTGPEPASQDLPAREERTVSAPQISPTRASSPLVSVRSCASPVAYKLTDLRRTIGSVTVTNDAEYLYVVYDITAEHWFISDTRLAVGRTYASIPQDNRNVPLPWSFPHSGEHEPVVTSVAYTFKLAELGVAPGQNVVVAAMAGVVHPKEGRYDGPWEWLVMWGLGNVQSEDGRVETIYNYTIANCGGAPPPPPPAGSGIVTITFDDGWLNTFTTAYPIMKEFGLRGNVAVNPDPIDGAWTGYMTLGQLRTLRDNGWSIVSHSLSHRDLTTLTEAELHRELRDSKAWVERNGFGPSDMFVVPFHAWGSRERTAIEQYYKRARGYAVNQFVPAMFVSVPVTRPFDLTGYEPEFAPYTTAAGRAQTMEYVRRAVSDGEFVDIFFHQIPAQHVAAFRTLLTEIAQYKANVKTYGEFTVGLTP